MNKKKKILCCIMIVVCLLLVACGKSQAAQHVDDLISSIGEVTLDSKNAIEEAESALNALDEKNREQVEDEEILVLARSEYDVLDVTEKIENLGNLDENSGKKVNAARAAYNGLTKEEKSRITNVDKLETAEEKMKEFRAKEVSEIISAIGAVTSDDACKERIEKAEAAYSDLLTDERVYVSNADILQKAKDTYANLRKKEYNGAVARMRVKYDEVRGNTFYTPKRVPYYTNSRSCMCPYIGMRDSRNWMKLRFNYAGSDWVFFKEATIAVDDNRYYKEFDYFDIQHDVGGGMVGEVIDIDPSSADISMLREIVTSQKTIVRFEGDDYYRDYTLNDADKAAIRDVLIMYDYLNE